MAADFRVERDSMGELQVPASALWGAQTQRAVNNFPISGLRMPPAFIRALGAHQVGGRAHESRAWACCRTPIASAIESSALEVANGMHADQFPIDVFQTGSGTSSNMNANEVIARLATRALGLAGAPERSRQHEPEQQRLDPVRDPRRARRSSSRASCCRRSSISPRRSKRRRSEVAGIVKTGRTHLMDAMPVRLDQELGGWAAQVRSRHSRACRPCMPRLTGLAQGGTAVGTGINAHPKFGAEFAAALAKQTGIDFHPAEDYFEALSSQDTAVELSGSAQDDGRQHHEDRERSALDEQRPARGPRARSRCRTCSPAAASCRAR